MGMTTPATLEATREKVTRHALDGATLVPSGFGHIALMLDELAPTISYAVAKGRLDDLMFRRLHSLVGTELARAGLCSKRHTADRDRFVSRVLVALIQRAA